jgi:hypothetical protein
MVQNRRGPVFRPKQGFLGHYFAVPAEKVGKIGVGRPIFGVIFC